MGKTGREGLDYSEERDAYEEEVPAGAFLVPENEVNSVEVGPIDTTPMQEDSLYGPISMDRLVYLQEQEKEEARENPELFSELEKKHNREINDGRRYTVDEFRALKATEETIDGLFHPQQGGSIEYSPATQEPPEEISIVGEDIGNTVVNEEVPTAPVGAKIVTVVQEEEIPSQEKSKLTPFLSRVKKAQEQGQEIPPSVMWSVLDRGTSEEKQWAADEIRKRREQGIEDEGFAASSGQIEELKKHNLLKPGKVYSAQHAAKVLKNILSARGIQEDSVGGTVEEEMAHAVLDENSTQESVVDKIPSNMGPSIENENQPAQELGEYVQPALPLDIENSENRTEDSVQESVNENIIENQVAVSSEGEYTQPELPLNQEQQQEPSEQAAEKKQEGDKVEEKSETSAQEEDKEKVEAKTIDTKVLEKFEAEMGIPKEALESLEGFSGLSRGQQLLALENLKKTAAMDIDSAGLNAYNEALKSSGLTGKMWKGMTKQYQIGKKKAEIAKKWREGGNEEILAMKMNTLGGVAKLIEHQNFDVEERENGKLSIAYVSEKTFGRQLTAEEREKAEWFNKMANQLENESFKEETGDKKKLREVLEERYTSALKDVTELFGDDVKGGLKWQQSVRSAVGMNRLFAENPDFEKDLTRNPNMLTFLSAMNTGVERVGIAGVSFGLRAAAVSAVGTIGMLAAAPVVGAVLGARREKQAQREGDITERMGEGAKKVALAERENMSAKQKESFERKRKTEKNFASADALAKKLSDEIDNLNSIDDDKTIEVAVRDDDGHVVRKEDGTTLTESKNAKEQAKIALHARIEYTKRKLEDDLVSLGKTPAERITMVNDLMESLGRAEASLLMEKPAVKSQLESRINSFLDVREERIGKDRFNATMKAGIKGAAWSLGFATFGTTIGALARHLYTGEEFSFLGVGTAKGSSVEDIRSAGKTGEIPPVATHSGGEVPTSPTSEPVFDEMMRPQTSPSETTYNMMHPGAEDLTSPTFKEPSAAFVNVGESTSLSEHVVASGDNLTHILKTEIPTLQGLTSFGKENAIRNLLNELSPEDLKDLGIKSGNPDLIQPGQTINLQRIAELLQEKQIHGENLIQHAQAIELNQGMHHAAESMATNMFSGKSDYINSLYENAVFGHQPTGASAELIHPLGGESNYVDSLYENAIFGKNSSAGEYVGPWKADTSSLSWEDFPDEVKIPHAEAMANMSLEEDIHQIFGEPASPLQKWPVEWENIRGRNMMEVFKEIQEYRLAKDTGVMEAGHDYTVISKLSNYLEEKEFTPVHDHMPYADESAEEFLTRSMMNEYMHAPHPSTLMNDAIYRESLIQTVGSKTTTFHGYGIETKQTVGSSGQTTLETPYGSETEGPFRQTVDSRDFSPEPLTTGRSGRFVLENETYHQDGSSSFDVLSGKGSKTHVTIPRGHSIQTHTFKGNGVTGETLVEVDKAGKVVRTLQNEVKDAEKAMRTLKKLFGK